MLSSSLESLLQSSAEALESGRGPLRLSGTTAPSRAFILWQFLLHHPNLAASRRGEQPLVVLVSQDDLAEELASDLETITQIFQHEKIRITHFPHWEHSLYGPVQPSLRSRRIRMEGLLELVQLRSNGCAWILITTLPALAQCTLSPTQLHRETCSLRLPEKRLRDEIVQALRDLGYLQMDLVEDFGTFALRGEILDFYPPGDGGPIRLGFFGARLETIRRFDPSTQTTVTTPKPLQAVDIVPVREVINPSATRGAFIERVRQALSTTLVRKQVQERIVSQLSEGIALPETFAPYADAPSATLWNYLLADSPLIWCNAHECEQAWDQFLDTQRQLRRDLNAGEQFAPLPEVLYPLDEARFEQLRERTLLYFDRLSFASLEAADPDFEGQSTTHPRVLIKSNTDITRGSKQSLLTLEPHFQTWSSQKFRVVIVAATASQKARIEYLLNEHGFSAEVHLGLLSEGFRWPQASLVMLNEAEVLGAPRARRARRGDAPCTSTAPASSINQWSALQALADLRPGDAVVHVDHGIGRYQGLVRLDLLGAPSDYLLVEYANQDKLYLPVYRLNVIQRYAGAGDSVSLDQLGSNLFQKRKEQVQTAVRRLAVDLVSLYAQRRVQDGVRIGPPDEDYRAFVASFPFEETPDQLKAIEAVEEDLSSGRMMDRLVCGDVGFGKTEVAIRAAYRVAAEGKQVVVLVPTTILAQQHEHSFRARLSQSPFRMESLSRFKPPLVQKKILNDLARGQIDILIGTHRVLSQDVRFRDLGLLIIDEEHRFGVEHKEKLKALKVNTHVLTLSATPIPRTLHLALSGLREMSLIHTPPVDRLPIRTYVSKFDEALIQRVVEFELARGGQVFYLHNRVDTLPEVAAQISRHLPQARVLIAHGQMKAKDLEETMNAFAERRGDVLVCTTLIESGLDIPTANTLIVNRADCFGLSQLYQIRGRVGRGQQRAYAYFLVPETGTLTEDAKRRLEVLQRFAELGSGFHIASQDLDLRGGGNILGAEQSGNVAAVGFDLYTELLDEAIRELAQTPQGHKETLREPEIKTPFAAFLNETYVADVHQRLSLYRRFSSAQSDAQVDEFEAELKDRYGPLPPEASQLLWIIRLKVLLKRNGLEGLTLGPARVVLQLGPQSRVDSQRLVACIASQPSLYSLTPDGKFVIKKTCTELSQLFLMLEALLGEVGPSIATQDQTPQKTRAFVKEGRC